MFGTLCVLTAIIFTGYMAWPKIEAWWVSRSTAVKGEVKAVQSDVQAEAAKVVAEAEAAAKKV